MRRPEFIAGLAGTMVAWPLAPRAQQPSIPVIGLLNTGSDRLLSPSMGYRRSSRSDVSEAQLNLVLSQKRTAPWMPLLERQSLHASTLTYSA
jgi:hypothetical protein